MAGKKDGKTKKKPKPAAAGKLTVTDDCFVPGRSLKIIYRGPNPATVASKLTSTFQPFFRISSAGWGEPLFRWDTSGDPVGFFIKWWVKKSFSSYSTMWLYIQLQGDENTQTKQGKFTLEFMPALQTSMPENWLLRGLFMFYNYLFYDKQRQDYIRECKNMALAYIEHIKSELGLPTGPQKQALDVHRL